MSKTIKDRLKIWHQDSDFLVFSDGSFGKGFSLVGFDISCKADEEINLFCEHLESLFVTLPEDYSLQFFYKLTPNVRDLIEEHKQVSSHSKAVYQPIRNARLDFLETNERNKNYFVPEIYCFVRGPAHSYRKKKLFEKTEGYRSLFKNEYHDHKSKFERMLTQIESGFRSLSLSPKPLAVSEWYKIAFSYLNFSRSSDIGIPELRDDSIHTILDQLILTDISVDKDMIKIGKDHFRVLTLALLPEGCTRAAMIDAFTKLPFHFWLCQNLKIIDQRKELSKLELNRRVANSMVSGSSNISDIESETKLGQIQTLVRELHEGSERMISWDFNVIIWGKDKEELETKTDEVLRAFRGLNQAEGLLETYAGLDAFLGSVPGLCEGFRHKKIKSSNAAHLIPLYACWKGNSQPVCLLPNRDSSLFSLDVFSKSLPAWNGLIFGGTGAGKSFTITQLMLQFYGQSPTPRIIWIDNGASSQRMLEVLDGEFIDLTLESGITLNLFDLEDGQTDPPPAKIKLILGILELILKDDEKKGLPKREKALLEETIFSLYKSKNGAIPVLSDLREALLNHKDLELKKFGQILFSWTGETAYGRMLDQQSNVKLTKDLTTIEIKGLDNHRDLKDIFLLLFTSYIKQEAARDLETPYLLIIDEAARLFVTPSAKDFAIDCFRTFRKYNAGIYCISQNYRDFLSDRELAESLLPNATNVFILRQRKIDWTDFKEAFDFNEAQVNAIKSLEIVKGKHSEFFLVQDEAQAVLRLVPEPLSYWICTSDGSDKAKIAAMERKYPNERKIEILMRLAKGEDVAEN